MKLKIYSTRKRKKENDHEIIRLKVRKTMTTRNLEHWNYRLEWK